MSNLHIKSYIVKLLVGLTIWQIFLNIAVSISTIDPIMGNKSICKFFHKIHTIHVLLPFFISLLQSLPFSISFPYFPPYFFLILSLIFLVLFHLLSSFLSPYHPLPLCSYFLLLLFLPRSLPLQSSPLCLSDFIPLFIHNSILSSSFNKTIHPYYS